MSQVHRAEREDGFMPFVQVRPFAGDYLKYEGRTSFPTWRIEEKVANNASVDEVSLVVFRERRIFRGEDDSAVSGERS